MRLLPTFWHNSTKRCFFSHTQQATCIGQIHKDFEQCNTKGAEKAKTFQIDLGTEWNKRLQCCGMWKLRDCWMKAARVKCSKAQAEQVFKLPHLFLPDLATSCAEYTPESGKCTIPMWLIASVVSGIVILLCTCLCGTVFCIKRLRFRNSRRNNVHRVHRKRATSNGGQTHQVGRMVLLWEVTKRLILAFLIHSLAGALSKYPKWQSTLKW